MASVPALPRSVAEAADFFVSSRHPRSTISTSAGIKAVRHLMPACEHTDDELAVIVAALAIRQRRNVAFDTELNQSQLSSPRP